MLAKVNQNIAVKFSLIIVDMNSCAACTFASYLLDYGWKAQVLTVSTNAYESISADQMAEVPSEVVVKRAFTLDTADSCLLKAAIWVGWRYRIAG